MGSAALATAAVVKISSALAPRCALVAHRGHAPGADSGNVRETGHSVDALPNGELSRELSLVPSRTALLIIDMQNYCCHPHGGAWRSASPTAYYLERLPHVLGNIRALLESARSSGAECIFTTIESLTHDGRDRSLDYKISGFNVPRLSLIHI